MKPFQRLAQPARALTAGDTPSTRLVRVKVHDPPRHVYHAGVFIHDHHAARAQHRAGFGHRVVVHRDVDLIARQQRTRTSAGDHRLDLFIAGYAARHLVDKLLHVHPKWHFVNAGFIDVPRDAQHACAAIFRRATIRIDFAALENNRWHGAQRLHVIDDCRASVQADDRGERRLDARVAPFALQRFHQRRFFTTLISARARMNEQVEIETRAKNIFPEITARIRFRNRRVDDIQHVAILPANINEALMRADSASRNDHAFDHLMRIHFHQRPVFASPRLGFVRVANHVSRFRRIFRYKKPLHARGEARAAAPAQVGFFHFFDDAFRRHLLQRFFQRLITVVL